MAAHGYDELSRHVGHNIECVGYGGRETPIYVGADLVGHDRQYDNVAVECVDCSEVLFDYDRK